MNRLHLVLAESELELVPRSITAHPQVRKDAKRASKRGHRRLLDSSVHHAAMRDLEGGDRRGRPDIVHLFLLTALESRLNKADRLRVHVHTRHDQLISVAPDTRLVRNYVRFVGLMEQLLSMGQVPPKGDALMSLEADVPLAEVIARTGADTAVALDPKGEATTPRALATDLDGAEGDACAVIGGFPRGDYAGDVASAVDRTVSFGPDPLTVWTVAAELLVHAASMGED